MKRLFFILIKIGLSALSGILLAFSQIPSTTSFIIAWFAFIPVFFVLNYSSKIWSLVHGTISGMVFYFFAFYWTHVFHPCAHLFITILAGLLFAGIPLFFISLFLKKKNMPLVLTPSLWVLFEYTKQNWFLAFPFGNLGYTQYSWLSFIQIADIGGTFLISWLIILVNVALFKLIITVTGKESHRIKLKYSGLYTGLLILVFTFPLIYGAISLSSLRYKKTSSLKIGFAQTLFHPRKVWIEHQKEYLTTINNFIDSFAGLQTDIVIFPELTMDRFLSFDQDIKIKDNVETLNGLSVLCKKGKINILIGSLELRQNEERMQKFNSMYLFSTEGELAGIYRKRYRVPFGEADPFFGLFPGLMNSIQSTTDAMNLDRGTEPHLFKIKDKKGSELKFGVLICFESGFPELTREYANNGVDFLINASNDYWALSRVAMSQHAVMSVFRAIECRKPVLRISNGGLSCYIDERGKYITRISVFTQGAMSSQLFLLDKKRNTVYVVFGDWIVLLSAFSILICTVICWIQSAKLWKFI